jgi:hypothetical protein
VTYKEHWLKNFHRKRTVLKEENVTFIFKAHRKLSLVYPQVAAFSSFYFAFSLSIHFIALIGIF